LSVLRASTTAVLPLRWLAALAQHSGDFLMRQPGSVLMTPGSDALNEVLRPFPPGEAPTFLPIVGNFQRGLVGEQPFHRRWLARGLDLLLKPILGVQHDWVVGTRQQYIVEPNSYPSGWAKDKPMPRHVHPSRHSEYFSKRGGAVPNKVPDRIEQFLRRGTSW
jgi:hypothetical protein